MAKLNAYLSFAGNTREVMEFYKSCIGGEVTYMEVAGSPMEEHMPPEMKNGVLHSMLVSGDMVLMASDMTPIEGLRNGNNFSLIINGDSEEQIRTMYDKLSEGGKKSHPVSPAFWGGLFGHLEDKYGVTWLVYFDSADQS